ncbi:MAG: sialidase family protein [Bryobacteraceae bacterium]|nr:sialidase family protein [Bryobacteraceae bacterium]
MRLLAFFLTAGTLAAQIPDARHISNGWTIPDESYADQPYIVKTDDGAWLCVLTTGKGAEGEGGQHVVSTRSVDRGKTWSPLVDVEPASGPEASYAVLLKVPSGRVYVFYNHNTDNVREIKGDDPPYKGGIVRRVDSFGHFAFKYSDDHGRTWSQRRYEIPQREFEIDRKNVYGGKIKFFWNVGRAFEYRGAGYVPLHKVGGFGEGFFTSSEGVLLRSANILTERDPEKIVWETLPEGDKGIRTPEGGGPVAEEQSFSILSDGSIFSVFRTIDGYSAYTYSRDGGRTWEPSQYMRYADGRRMKHPRAANFAWRCANGKFLYWFHNHGGRFILEHPRRRSIAYEERNPVWLVGGVEIDSPRGKEIAWSQPEIAIYDDDPWIRMSYPDLVEDGGRYYLTETQKDVARVHEIDKALLEGLWNQATAVSLPRAGLLLEASRSRSLAVAELPQFVRRSSARADHGIDDLRRGVSIELWALGKPGDILASNRTPDGRGFTLQVGAGGAVEIVMGDGRAESRWRSDSGAIEPSRARHITVIVDGGPKIVSFVTDGRFNDGGEERQFGWGRYHPHLRSLNGSPQLMVGDGVAQIRLYGRALRVSEAVALFRAGKETRAAR